MLMDSTKVEHTVLNLTPTTPAVPNCCCSKGSVPYWSNPPFLIFDIRALWRSVLSARAPECRKLTSSLAMAKRSVRLCCAVPTPEKFIVQLSAVVIRQASPAQNMFVYVARSAFLKEVGHFRRIFHREGASPTKHCWCQKTRVIALLCAIKISAVHHLVLSQYTHLTDRWTDRIATAIPCVALHAVAR